MIDITTAPPVTQLMRDLKVLGTKIERSGVRTGLREVAKPVISRQKAWAESHRSHRQQSGFIGPMQPGRGRLHLADAINAATFSARTMRKLGVIRGTDYAAILTLAVGPNKKVNTAQGTAYVGRFLDRGTKDKGRKGGVIKPHGSKQALHPGGDVFWSRANHKGVNPSQWVTKSIDGVPYDQLFYKGLQAFIDKQAEAK